MNSNVKRKYDLVLFLLGLGASTRVLLVGCLSFSEIFAFFAAPLILLREYAGIKRLRAANVIWLLGSVIGMIVVSSFYNHAPLVYTIKDCAVYYSILSFVIVFVHYLSKDLSSLRWYFIGAFLSSIITIFILNPRAAMTAGGSVGLDQLNVSAVMSGELFWVEKVTSLLQLPIESSYLSVPIIYALMVPFVVIAVAVVTSSSGRSASLIVLLGAFMVAIGRKSRRRMAGIGRHLLPVGLLGIVMIFIFKQAYYSIAEAGLLNEGATAKYLHQTQQGKGLLALVIGGRIEPFVGIRAALDKPIVGYGSLPIDRGDYYYDTLVKFGNEEDVGRYEYERRKNPGSVLLIQTHSHIVSAWVTCGIVGLAFWLYVLWLMYQFIRRYAAAIPQWYGYFTVAFPYYAWHIFFSPIATRRQDVALFIACLLLARAIGKRYLQLPMSMEMEARRYD